ncbi:hypothetical protein PC121_g18405 [Phytophthora cactorum]|nr:hypothetical protein PC121_g18405 [Phytophthora cactorum]KAG4045758.1 hypothetical protein PC123_g18850 [Phytophthora cactorum]
MGIEIWGWYRFLLMLETSGHRDLMWWGGAPGKGSKAAKNFAGNPVLNLLDLQKRDPVTYDLKITL